MERTRWVQHVMLTLTVIFPVVTSDSLRLPGLVVTHLLANLGKGRVTPPTRTSIRQQPQNFGPEEYIDDRLKAFAKWSKYFMT